MIDNHLDAQDKLYVRLFEDNAGGLWLSDTNSQWAWFMGIDGCGGTSFYSDASDLFVDDIDGWEVDNRYAYSEAIEPQDETRLIAEWDGNALILYPDAMGHGAKRYTKIAE